MTRIQGRKYGKQRSSLLNTTHGKQHGRRFDTLTAGQQALIEKAKRQTIVL